MIKKNFSNLLKVMAVVLASAMLFSACTEVAPADGSVSAASAAVTDTPAAGKDNGDIVILFTNDVHCGVDETIGYAGLAAYKKLMEEEGNNVCLVDDGDSVQGGYIGMLSKGEAVIRIMNQVGYDLVIPGNHEFDYGMDQFLKLTQLAEFPYISCNIKDLRTGERVLQPYVIKELGDKKIAFIGVTTPSSMTSSNPKYFQDENGEFIYGFSQGGDGSGFYQTVQDAVDSARAEGADYCIMVSHLGIEYIESPYMSTDVIKNTTGIDVVCDGHSHTVMQQEFVKNKDGENVILSQTGTKLKNIGKLTIKPNGTIESTLVTNVPEKDEAVTAAIEEEYAACSEIVDRIVIHSDYYLTAMLDDGTWLIRNNETNLGDLVADAIKEATGAEIGIINAGGIRCSLDKGDITYGDLIDMAPFENEISIQKVKGQELLDALEYSVAFFPEDSNGFLQVSGLTFDVIPDNDPGVRKDDNNMFLGFSRDERRVANVKVNGVPLDPQKEYTVGGLEYILFEKGDGYTMFTGERVETDKKLIDRDVIEEYLNSFGGSIPPEYEESQERIHYVE